MPVPYGYIAISNKTLNIGGLVQLSPYSGPVPGVKFQYLATPTSTSNLVLITESPDVFVRGANGNDAIGVGSGRAILDGGTGSNFLSGGSGVDTFFVDGRGTGITWSTIVGFHAGDDATIWGFVPGVSKLTWAANDGTAGYTGATVHIDLRNSGTVDASMTFAGITLAKAQSYAQVAGNVGGNNYLHFTAN